MANRPPPLFALSTVQEILRSYDKPITMGVIERELNLRHVEKLDSHKLKQRIHVLVHSGKIKAEPDSLDSRVRWYSLPDVTPPAPVKVEAAEPAPMEPPAPAEIVPVIDLKGTVNAIADAVAAAIGDVLRTRIEAVVHDQLQQALDSLPAQITQVIAEPKGTVRTLNPGPVQAPKAPGKTRITIVGLAEVQMGVDGRMTAGFVPNPVKQTITLQADSPSKDIFTVLIQAMKTAREVYFVSGSIALPSTGEAFTLTRGILTNAKQIPDAQKVLQPVDYVITWESVNRSLL
jgi:hypothetical protein